MTCDLGADLCDHIPFLGRRLRLHPIVDEGRLCGFGSENACPAQRGQLTPAQLEVLL